MNIPQSAIHSFGQIGIPTLQPQTETYTFTTESGLEMIMVKQRVFAKSRKLNIKIQWEDSEVIHE